jgi:hypothetical protein
VSCVGGKEAELTGAMDATGARRRPWNERQRTTVLHGCVRCERKVRGGLLLVLLSKGSERVSAGSRKRSGTWGSGQEMHDVGASVAGCAGGRLGKGRRLTGGVREPARAHTQTDGQN